MDYFGVIAFEVNSETVSKLPTDWSDLAGPAYRNAVALAGHPHRTNEAIQAILSAGMAATGGKVAFAGEAGLRFFADLQQRGNFVERAGNALTVAEKSTPVVLRWDYAALADRDKIGEAAKIRVVIPRSGLVATPYALGISAHAPHPNAAKLWMDFLLSDEGQLGFLGAYCNPSRYRDLAARGRIPPELAARLPAPEAYDAVIFPDPAAQNSARETIVNGWNRFVGAAVN
jgi:putative spermidine/putrescine transport system substrate-binding protein